MVFDILGKVYGSLDAKDEITKERIQQFKLIQSERNKKNDLLTEEEQTEMKYKGKTIHKNKKCDSWYTRVRINGRQEYITGKTQKECYNNLKKALNEKNTQTIKSNITFIEWYNQFFELYKKDKIKDSTIKSYNTSLNHLSLSFKNKAMKNIIVADIIKILNGMSETEREAQKLYEFLNMLFKKAKDNQIIPNNILKLIEKPDHKKDNGIALTLKQEEKLIGVCNKINKADYLLVTLFQGMRRGESLALSINDVDFINNTITIDKSYNQDNKLDTTKNGYSVRIIPLFERTKEILLKYKNIKGRIFNLSIKQVQSLMDNIREQLDFYIKIKDMRSTFITRCEELGIPETVVQAWVGHRIGSKITKRVYTKVNQDNSDKYIYILNNSKFYSNSTQKK